MYHFSNWFENNGTAVRVSGSYTPRGLQSANGEGGHDQSNYGTFVQNSTILYVPGQYRCCTVPRYGTEKCLRTNKLSTIAFACSSPLFAFYICSQIICFLFCFVN